MATGSDPISRVVQNLFVLRRLGNSITGEAEVLLRDLFDNIVDDLQKIDPTGPALKKWQRHRSGELLKQLDSRIKEKMPEVEKLVRDRLAVGGRQQGKVAEASLVSTLGDKSSRVRPTPVTQSWTRALLNTQPFDGFVLADWFSGLGRTTQKRLTQTIQNGVTQELSIPELVRQVRGRQAGFMKDVNGRSVRRFVGGVMETTTRDAEAIVRTAVTSVSSHAHLETYRKNKGVLLGIQYSATLDDRTTVICLDLDGSIWEVDSPEIVVPGDATHFNCRSTLIPVPDYEAVGLEPPDDGFRKARDLSGLSDADLKRKVSARRGSGLLGKQKDVRSSTTAAEWLRDQPNRIQNKMLGARRAELFREGQLSLKQMVGSDRKLVPLRELRGTVPIQGPPPGAAAGAIQAPVPPAVWDPAAAQSPAELARRGLLTGQSREVIEETLQSRFPDYNSWKIAYNTYKRELQKKGFLDDAGLPIGVIDEGWTTTGFSSPADLARDGLLKGIAREEIEDALKREFPDYKSWKIAYNTYKRQLQKKGLLGDDGLPIGGGTGGGPTPPPTPKPKPKPEGSWDGHAKQGTIDEYIEVGLKEGVGFDEMKDAIERNYVADFYGGKWQKKYLTLQRTLKEAGDLPAQRPWIPPGEDVLVSKWGVDLDFIKQVPSLEDLQDNFSWDELNEFFQKKLSEIRDKLHAIPHTERPPAWSVSNNLLAKAQGRVYKAIDHNKPTGPRWSWAKRVSPKGQGPTIASSWDDAPHLLNAPDSKTFGEWLSTGSQGKGTVLTYDRQLLEALRKKRAQALQRYQNLKGAGFSQARVNAQFSEFKKFDNQIKNMMKESGVREGKLPPPRPKTGPFSKDPRVHRKVLDIPEDQRPGLKPWMKTTDAATKKRAQEGWDRFESLVPRKYLEPHQVPKVKKLPKSAGGREYYSDGPRAIFTQGNTSIDTVIHEFGHWLEYRNPEIRRAAQEFLQKKVEGDPLRKLSTITGNSAYKASEVARPDKFFSPYVGKDYSGSPTAFFRADATEVITMGLEYMDRDPAGFFLADPDHFDLIFRLIRGQL